MNSTLEVIVRNLQAAKSPFDIFGALDGTPDQMLAKAKGIYTHLAKVTHPDTYHEPSENAEATKAFAKLSSFYRLAQTQIQNGTYSHLHSGSSPGGSVTVSTKRSEVQVGTLLARGDIANLYRCTYEVAGNMTAGIFKVARSPHDNDLMQNEARALQELAKSSFYKEFAAFVPALVHSFLYQEGSSSVRRQANIFSWLDGLYSLEEVLSAYPNGVDPRDMAWIWRRLTAALGFAHESDNIHGAVLPSHVLIHPEQHGLVLIDWTASVNYPTNGAFIRTISPTYKDWYPKEVFDKESPLPGLDNMMGAMCMIRLMGGNPKTGNLPASIPTRERQALEAFFRGCTQRNPVNRPQDAWGLREEFDRLIERLYGPRRFHPFSMPKKA